MTDQPPDEVRCEYCRFWDATSTGNNGWCRKKPPVPFLGKRFAEALWPMTGASDWCGAFKVRK